jgi:23S rRNA (guanosine2251-2'-O)-methyltransferase
LRFPFHVSRFSFYNQPQHGYHYPMSAAFSFYECLHGDCRLRFPAPESEAQRCPRCRGPLQPVAQPVTLPAAHGRSTPAPPVQLHLLLDNIRSLHNVGSIFRTADGAGVAHLYLCGITPTPDNPRLAKTALGAENNVRWSYHANGVETAVSLQQAGHRLWAIEQCPTSTSLFAASDLPAERPLTLLLGNEKTGVDPGLLALCEQTHHLPMQGHKRSLNVAVAAGTAVYYLVMGKT